MIPLYDRESTAISGAVCGTCRGNKSLKTAGEWPRAVIFDMDGLMYGTEQQIRQAWDDVGPEIAGKPLGNDIYNTMGMNRALRVKYFRDTYGVDFPYDKFETAYKARVAEIKEKEGIPVKPGLFELLAYLSEERIPAVLATGSSSFHTYQNLAFTKTPDVFRYVICGDMVEAAKPDPYIYRLSCRLLGMQPEEVLVLEDSVNGVLAASAAKTPVIMIPDLQKGRTEAVEGMPLVMMESLLEVRAWLQQHRQR